MIAMTDGERFDSHGANRTATTFIKRTLCTFVANRTSAGFDSEVAEKIVGTKDGDVFFVGDVHEASAKFEATA